MAVRGNLTIKGLAEFALSWTLQISTSPATGGHRPELDPSIAHQQLICSLHRLLALLLLSSLLICFRIFPDPYRPPFLILSGAPLLIYREHELVH